MPVGARVTLADGRIARVSARMAGDVLIRAITDERWEWAPEKFAAREGELEIRKGFEEVEHG